MSSEEFLDLLIKHRDGYNYLENCPYLYGKDISGLLHCPITYINGIVNHNIVSIDKWSLAKDLLKLENAESIANATDGIGEETLRVRILDIIEVNKQNKQNGQNGQNSFGILPI